MNNIDVPVSCFSLFKRVRISACIVTSKAVVGSSAIKILGLHANAIAITILCLIPPESS